MVYLFVMGGKDSIFWETIEVEGGMFDLPYIKVFFAKYLSHLSRQCFNGIINRVL